MVGAAGKTEGQKADHVMWEPGSPFRAKSNNERRVRIHALFLALAIITAAAELPRSSGAKTDDVLFEIHYLSNNVGRASAA